MTVNYVSEPDSRAFTVDRVWCRRKGSLDIDLVDNVDVFVFVDEDNDTLIDLKFSVNHVSELEGPEEEILLLCALNVQSVSKLMVKFQESVKTIATDLQKRHDRDVARRAAVSAWRSRPTNEGWQSVVEQVKKELGID